jgi:hypothetical protein
MTKLAHIRNGSLIRTYVTGKGWVDLENGQRASPPVDGYVNGNDKVVPYVDEIVDTSTKPQTVTTTVDVVEANRVVRRTTISDMSIEAVRADMRVSRMQALIALQQTGLLPQVETLMESMDASTKIAWAETAEFNRNSALLNSLAPQLKWPDGRSVTDTDLDDLFTLAASISL